MKSVTASNAKQNFGALLASAANEPVRIVRHGKEIAAVVPPEWLEKNASAIDPRHVARTAMQERDRMRQDKHQRIAIILLTEPAKERKAIIDAAKRMVDRWQDEQLCSPDYIARWRAWLSLPITELAKAMTSVNDPWAKPMRQNSPFVLST